uniref:Major facilitator superfamily (MFS) profile domain-containing protein n=1 Tax=Ditylenchus dipsaci TaxID=166011 RepID=A0A915EQI0_9BILA
MEDCSSKPVAKAKEPNIFCNKFRYFILILGTLCMTSIFSNMITLNFTIICMDSQNKTGTVFEGIEEKPSESVFEIARFHDYTAYEKTMLQWTVSISAMLATFPFTWLCTQFGARYVFFASGMLSTFSTALIPPASALGLGWFIAVRVLQGLAYASDFAVIGVLCTRWASLRENAKFLGVLTCFSPLSSVLTNSVSGVICDTPALGWPWVHYVHAMASFAQRIFVPYLDVIKDKVVWSVWLNAFADIFSGYFLIIYAPTYLKKVLQYSTTETGFFGALIAGAHIPIKLGAGYISDSFNCLPERKKMWVFNSIALLCPAAIYVYACFAPLDHPFITVLLFGGVHATLGFNCGGFYKCGALVSRQYAEVVIALLNS